VGVDWIDLVEDRRKWRVVVNAVVNFLLPESVGNFLLAEERLAPQGLLHGVSRLLVLCTVLGTLDYLCFVVHRKTACM
jgi:hypothetical protein